LTTPVPRIFSATSHKAHVRSPFGDVAEPDNALFFAGDAASRSIGEAHLDRVQQTMSKHGSNAGAAGDGSYFMHW